MKTDQLVSMLANQVEPVDVRAGARRMAMALGAGALVSAVLMQMLFGVRPDLLDVLDAPVLWLKFLVAGALAVLAVPLVERLGRPGMRWPRWGAALLLPLLACWAIGLQSWVGAAPDARSDLLFGETWDSCPWNIALLSAPLMLGLFWALRSFAATRPVLTGAVAGLAAGSIAMGVYSLHCPEMGAPFVAVWYVLGIAIPTALGAVLGPRLLRW